MQLLQTFTRCIVLSQKEADYDEILARHLVEFMLNHHVVVMKVCDELKVTVEETLARKRQTKVAVSNVTVSACFL
jgi:hypothetical protein